MAKHRIVELHVVMEDGTKHVWEGNGNLTVVRTRIVGDRKEKIPSARVEVVMPVPSEIVATETITPTVPLS